MLKIITAPANEPVTVDEAKQHLRIDGSNEDSLISTLIKAARIYVETLTNRRLITQTLRLQLKYFPFCEIVLPVTPVQSVAAIRFKDKNGIEQVAAETLSQLSFTEPPKIKPSYGESWPQCREGDYNSVSIDIVAGYGDAADVPRDLCQAILLMVAHFYEQREPVAVANSIDSEILPMSVQSIINMNRLYL